MRAAEIKKGNVVEHNNAVWQIRDIERSSPQGRGGNVTFRFTMYSVPGGQKLDLSLRAEDELKEVELVRRQASFSYKDGEAFVFLDAEDYTPYQLDADVVGEDAGYIVEGLEGCFVQLIDEFKTGSRAFGVNDFRASYSPAQWTDLSQRLRSAGFSQARVFLQIEPSDEMQAFLSARGASPELPTRILD